MIDRFTSMAVFVYAAERRSFAAAADRFGMSATMVGKHIRALEARVGAKLLHRTTRQQSLTEVGRLYYERCKQLLADAEDADACADELKAIPRGVLKIHSPVTFGSLRLAPALANYLRQFPDVKVDLTLSDRAMDLVEDGYEAAIRIGPLPDSGLIARQLRPYEMWLCASPAYLRRTGMPQCAADLAKHDCLGFTYWRHKNVWRLKKSECEESVQIKGRFTVNNGQALRMAAIEGLGVILQPEILVSDDVASGKLTRLLPEYELPSRSMYIVYHSDKRATPKLRSFVEFVAGEFG